MKYSHGKTGNQRGRPKGSCSGRMKALSALDGILAQDGSKRTLAQALKDEFTANPVKFFKDFVMPLLPKEAKVVVEQDVVVQWQSMLGPPLSKPESGGVITLPDEPG